MISTIYSRNYTWRVTVLRFLRKGPQERNLTQRREGAKAQRKNSCDCLFINGVEPLVHVAAFVNRIGDSIRDLANRATIFI